MKTIMQGTSTSRIVGARLPGKYAAPVRIPRKTNLKQVDLGKRSVEARIFGNLFGKKNNDEDRPTVANMGRDYYDKDEVEHYFNYMGLLATFGTYDKMDALLNTGQHPVDIILLLASAEGDLPKVQEVLDAGASLNAKDAEGKTPMQLASKPEVQNLLKDYEAKAQASK